MPLVLIVEDEIALRETLAYNLKRQDYTVEAVGDGLTALAAARRRHLLADPTDTRVIPSR